MSKRERMGGVEKWQDFKASNSISSLYKRRNQGLERVGKGKRRERHSVKER